MRASITERLGVIEDQLSNAAEHYGDGHLHCGACATSIQLSLRLVGQLLEEVEHDQREL